MLVLKIDGFHQNLVFYLFFPIFLSANSSWLIVWKILSNASEQKEPDQKDQPGSVFYLVILVFSHNILFSHIFTIFYVLCYALLLPMVFLVLTLCGKHNLPGFCLRWYLKLMAYRQTWLWIIFSCPCEIDQKGILDFSQSFKKVCMYKLLDTLFFIVSIIFWS